jgi:hypothetical protein
MIPGIATAFTGVATDVPVASLGDQFTVDPKLFDVRKPKALCVPVDKNGEGIEGQIHTANSFGQERLDTKKEYVLCVPALVTSAP